MKFTVIPFIFAIEFAAIAYATFATVRADALASSGARWIYGLLALLTLWGATSVYLGANGAYLSDQFLSLGAPYWLPFVPVGIVVLPLAFFREARQAVNRLIDHTPMRALIAIHGLRILALGGIIKAWNGEFSAPIGALIGVPDFLFGVSAFVMAWLALKQRVSTWSLVAWNAIGATIIVPNILIVIWLSMPGPWQLFSAEPTIMTLFAFPMALAPTLAVPILVMMNMLVAGRLIERLIETRNAGSRPKLGHNSPGLIAELDA